MAASRIEGRHAQNRGRQSADHDANQPDHVASVALQLRWKKSFAAPVAGMRRVPRRAHSAHTLGIIAESGTDPAALRISLLETRWIPWRRGTMHP
jgi:hypothetical protein